MQGFAVVLDQHWLYRMDHEQRVELIGRGEPSASDGGGEDAGQVGTQELEPVEIKLSHRDSKKWAVRYELAKRLTAAQRVGIGFARTRIDQPHCKFGERSDVHAGPYGRESEPALRGVSHSRRGIGSPLPVSRKRSARTMQLSRRLCPVR